MKRSFSDLAGPFAVVAALAACATSFIWSGWGRHGSDVLLPSIGETRVTPNPVPRGSEVSVPSEADWLEPTAQAGGSAWRFDLFTPPEIYCDERGRLLARNPDAAIAHSDSPAVTVSAITAVPYRLRLVGWFGDAEDPAAAFAVTGSKRALLCHAGEEIPGAKAQFLRGDWVTRDGVRTRVAVLRDRLVDRELQLAAGERAQESGAWLARIELPGSGAMPAKLVREGDEFAAGDRWYLVDEIAMPQGEVTLLVADANRGVLWVEALRPPAAAESRPMVLAATATPADEPFHDH